MGGDVMATSEILEALTTMDESPWADLKGGPLNARGLALRLKNYGIGSRQVRIGERTVKGYRRADLHDAWIRYLPPLPPSTKKTRETNETTATDCPRCAGKGCQWCDQELRR